MGTAKFEDYTHLLPPLKMMGVTGGSAGDHTLTGVATVDKLLSVFSLDLTGADLSVVNFSAVTDLTSEFSITAANTINNTGGTDTTGALLFVLWADYDR